MIKKLKLFLIAIVSLAILTSCSNFDIDVDFGSTLDKFTSIFSSDNDTENTGDGSSVDNGRKQGETTRNFEKVKNDNLERIFHNMAEAIRPVESISSVIISEQMDDDEESPMKTTTRMKTILDPLVFHVDFDGPVEMMEMYANEHDVYANVPGQGWVRAPDDGAYLKHVSQQINEDHILHFNNYLEHFEAESDGTHYIITYIGPDEMFNEIFFNEDLLAEVFGGLFTSLEGFIDLEYSGDVTMKVSKETFLLDEQLMKTHSVTSILGFKLESVEHTKQTFTYDDVEPFSIPKEVIQSAQSN